MIRHIVMWTVKPTQQASSAENAASLKQKLDNLIGVIPDILMLETGINQIEDADAMHVVLNSSFENWEALKRYQQHPAHKKVGEFVKQVRIDRRVVDFETS